MALSLKYGLQMSLPSVCGGDPDMQMTVHGVPISIPAMCNQDCGMPTPSVHHAVSVEHVFSVDCSDLSGVVADVSLQDALEVEQDDVCRPALPELVRINSGNAAHDALADEQRQPIDSPQPMQDDSGDIRHDVQTDRSMKVDLLAHSPPAQHKIDSDAHDLQAEADVAQMQLTQSEIASFGHDEEAEVQKESQHPEQPESVQNDVDVVGHDVQVDGYEVDADDVLDSSSATGTGSVQDQAAELKPQVSFPRLSFRPAAVKTSTASTVVPFPRPSFQVSSPLKRACVAEPSLEELVDGLLSNKSAVAPDAHILAAELGPPLINKDYHRWGAELLSSCAESSQGPAILPPVCSWPAEDEPEEDPAHKLPAPTKSAQEAEDDIYADLGCDRTSGMHTQEWLHAVRSAQPKSAAWPVRNHTSRIERSRHSDARARSRSRRAQLLAGPPGDIGYNHVGGPPGDVGDVDPTEVAAKQRVLTWMKAGGRH